MGTVHERNAGDNEVVDELVGWLQSAVEQRVSIGADFEEREAAALRIANEMTQKYLQTELQQIADEHGERVLVDGQEHRRHEMGTVKYFSLCGPLQVTRYTYRAVGATRRGGRNQRYVRSVKSVVPVELATGLLDRTTPALAYSLAHGYAQGPMRGYEEAMQAAHRLVPPRATLERKAKAIAGAAKQEVMRIEPCLRRAERVPIGAHAIAVGLDRTSVPMIEERPPDTAPNSRRKPRKAPYIRTPPHPFDVNWRMGYVGTVSLVDESSNALVSRRYAATAEEGPDELVARMMGDVTRALAQDPNLTVTIVQDGAPELWGVLREAMRANGIKKWREVIDRYHLNERLACALAMVEPDPLSRRRIYAEWHKQLDTKQLAIHTIKSWLEKRCNKVAKGNRKEFRAHTTYLFLNERRLRYARMKREGLPIGSGVTEGTCKSLYAARVKRSGQRWYQDGLTGVLTLRALHLSERLPRFWRHFTPRFRRCVQAIA